MAIACPGCLHCLRVKGLPEDLPVYDIGQSLPFDVPSQLGRAEALVASFGSLEGQRIRSAKIAGLPSALCVASTSVKLRPTCSTRSNTEISPAGAAVSNAAAPAWAWPWATSKTTGSQSRASLNDEP